MHLAWEHCRCLLSDPAFRRYWANAAADAGTGVRWRCEVSKAPGTPAAQRKAGAHRLSRSMPALPAPGRIAAAG